MNDFSNLKDEFDYYKSNKASFVEKYNGKFVALKNHSVICEAISREEAVTTAIREGNPLGTFLVQHVSNIDDESVQRFHSRVYVRLYLV